MAKISAQNDHRVKDFIISLKDEQTLRDSFALIEMMQRISGHINKIFYGKLKKQAFLPEDLSKNQA